MGQYLGKKAYYKARCHTLHEGPVSRKSRKLFGPEKPFVKLRPAYSVKLVFSYVVKGLKIKRTAKFRASRRLRFEDTKRVMSPEMLPKSYGTFEKRAPAPWCGHHRTHAHNHIIRAGIRQPWTAISGFEKPALASIGYALLMRPNKAEIAVHGFLIPTRVIWCCTCVR